jgi:hypothetical protein
MACRYGDRNDSVDFRDDTLTPEKQVTMTAPKRTRELTLSDDGELPEGITETTEQEYIVCRNCGEYLPTDGNPYCYGCGNWITRSSTKDNGLSPISFTDSYRMISGLVFLAFLFYSMCMYPFTHIYTDKNPDLAFILFVVSVIVVLIVTKRVWRFFHDRIKI